MPADREETRYSQMKKLADKAQYGGSDYSNVVRVERGISLQEAFAIAESDSEIGYFVYLKGGCMVLPVDSRKPCDDPFHLISNVHYLEDSDGSAHFGGCRVFHHGDTVFFKKQGMWLGSAFGLADTYTKE